MRTSAADLKRAQDDARRAKSEVNAERGNNKQLRKDMRDLQQRLRDMDSAASEVNGLKDELRRARDEISSAQRRIDVAVKEKNALSGALEESLERLSSVEHASQERRDKDSQEANRLRSEREQLVNEVDSAANHLRLVAAQKSSITKELEQVYAALAQLEDQLKKSKSENDRLRASLMRREASDKLYVKEVPRTPMTASKPSALPPKQSASASRRAMPPPPPVYSSSSAASASDAGITSTTVHVSRSGSVDITERLKLPASVKALQSQTSSRIASNPPAPRVARLATGAAAPYSRGYDASIGSIRRGSYFGLYSDAEGQARRRLHRTNSTVDRRKYNLGD